MMRRTYTSDEREDLLREVDKDYAEAQASRRRGAWFDIARAVCSVFCCPPIPSRIVAKLAFVPPNPPGYTIRPQQASGNSEMVLLDVFGNAAEPFSPDCAVSAFRFDAGRHRVAAVYLKRQAARYTLLVSHGNGEDLGYVAPFLESLGRELGVSVFAYDYPGYGESDGTPREALLYRAVEAAWCCLRERFGVPAKRIILYGTSIGSAPSVHLAAKFGRRFGEGSAHCPAALVLHAPLASGIRVLRPSTSMTWCCDPFANISRISAVTVPTLIMHGTDDEIVPVAHSYKLQARCDAAVEPLFVHGGEHNDLDTYPAFYARLKRFVTEVDAELGLKPESEA